MEKFLTIMLFIFVGFWLMGIIGRWLLRYWILKKQRQFARQFGGDLNNAGTFGGKNFRGFYSFGGFPGGNSAQAEQPDPKKEGEITITRRSSTTTVSKSVGEYIEYEEEVDTVGRMDK